MPDSVDEAAYDSDILIKKPALLAKFAEWQNRAVLVSIPFINFLEDLLGPSKRSRPASMNAEDVGSSPNDRNRISFCLPISESLEKNTAARDRVEGEKASSVAASSKESVTPNQSSDEPTWNLRYSTFKELQQFVRSIDDEKYRARHSSTYDTPRIPADCVAEPDWLPYYCFVCDQTPDSWKEIKNHLRNRHSIIMAEKVEAWECFYPECTKRFPSRAKALKHAEDDHWRQNGRRCEPLDMVGRLQRMVGR
jgi:hypothetical protein